MHIVANTANELFKKACNNVMLHGEDVSPRGLPIKEVMCALLELNWPKHRIITLPSRNLNMRYLIGELCFYLSSSKDLRFISHYSKFWNAVSDDGVHVNSGYGAYLFRSGTGIDYAVRCLEKDRDSRKAVVPIYSAWDHSKESNDNPCTMYVQFLIRKGRLFMITNMRSNDLWFGLSYDLPFFTLVQEIVLLKLLRTYPDLILGSYLHHVGSLHIYQKNFEQAAAVTADTSVTAACTSPDLSSVDLSSWFAQLLGWEYFYRTGYRDREMLMRSPPTDFQDWAIEILSKERK